MIVILTRLLAWLVTCGPAVKVMFAVAAFALAFAGFLAAMWSRLFAALDTLVLPTLSSADFSPFGLVNYVFPLDTLLTMLAAMGAVKVIAATIRIIKSFIPTIA